MLHAQKSAWDFKRGKDGLVSDPSDSSHLSSTWEQQKHLTFPGTFGKICNSMIAAAIKV